MPFDEEETGRLIQRATELHEQSLGNSEHNLTLSEIESIAEDLDIPKQFLIEAALEQRSQPSAKSFNLWGAPFRVDHTKLVDGPINDEQWGEAVAELQEMSGKTGSTESTGTTRRWSHSVGEADQGFSFEELSVRMKPVEGRTAIQLKQEYKGAIAMYLMAFGVTSFLTLIVAHSLPDVPKLTELLLAGLGGGLSLGGVRAMIAVSARRYKDQLSDMADRLQQVLGKGTSTVGTQRADSESNAARTQPVLDLPDGQESVTADQPNQRIKGRT